MTRGLRWLRSIFRWGFCCFFFFLQLRVVLTTGLSERTPSPFCRAPVSTISHSSLLPTKSALHEQPLQSSISLLSSLFTLSTLDDSLCSLDYLYTFTSPPAPLSLSLFLSRSVCLSLSEPCELATLSALSIWAYRPRGPERITFLTSLCQMFTTKIDGTTSRDTKSNNAFSLNLTPRFWVILLRTGPEETGF